MASFKRLAGQLYFATMIRLSRLGERLGWEWLVYNPLVHLAFERSARRNAPPFVDCVARAFPQARTLVDVGCGTGTFAAEFQRRGLQVAACEYSDRLQRKARAKGVSVFPFDLSKNTEALPGSPFDLAVCLEVAEHIPASLADALVAFVAGSGRSVVFTAAHPGQGGTGHINEQPKSYWIERFERHGMSHDADKSKAIAGQLCETRVEAFMHENLMVFQRRY
jgi:SAM-dependent methyltransferase